MNQDNRENKVRNSEEVYLSDVLLKIRAGIRYLKSKWLIVLIIGLLSGLLGLVYSLTTKPIYTASCTFVLDEGSRGNVMSQYAGLASLVGIDLGSGGSGGGLFQGDNILELYKSRLMIEKALLSESIFNGKKELLIDRYFDYGKLKTPGKEKDTTKKITFQGDPESFNRKQDSIITDLVETFNKGILKVDKPDKRLSIIKVQVSSPDELFAKNFTDKLVKTVNDFYVQTKTKKESETVKILQKQSDSLRTILNSSLSRVASALETDPNANPAMVSLKVPSQKRQIDVQQNSAIYSEVVKNLELSKMSLRHDTPLIQVIDKPVLPLKVTKIGKKIALIVGFILGVVVSSLFLLVRRSLSVN